jgi:hypothetical protein
VKDLRNLLVRAIITGFGLRIGAEVAKFVAQRVLPGKDENKDEGDEDDESLGTITADPPDLEEVG